MKKGKVVSVRLP